MSTQDQEWSLKVRSKEFAPALSNALLFDGTVFPNIIMKSVGNTLTLYSGDGYVLIKTSCEIEGVDDFTVMLAVEDAEKLYNFAKKVKDLVRTPGYVNILLDESKMEILVNESGTDDTEAQENLILPVMELTQIGLKILTITESDYEETAPECGNIRILPDRLSGMWRLKVAPSMMVKGIVFPMDWKYFQSPHHPGQTIAVVKHGPGTILVIAGLHKVLEEKYPDVAERCLWKTSVEDQRRS